MNKVSSAIDTVYEIIMQEWQNGGKHNINLAIALDQLAPYYHDRPKVYDESRKAYWKCEIAEHSFTDDDGNEIELTEKQLEYMAEWLRNWDVNEDNCTFGFADAIYEAYKDCKSECEEG